MFYAYADLNPIEIITMPSSSLGCIEFGICSNSERPVCEKTVVLRPKTLWHFYRFFDEFFGVSNFMSSKFVGFSILYNFGRICFQIYINRFLEIFSRNTKPEVPEGALNVDQRILRRCTYIFSPKVNSRQISIQRIDFFFS